MTDKLADQLDALVDLATDENWHTAAAWVRTQIGRLGESVRADYRVYITGGGATPGLHQSTTVKARSVGEAIDQVITETGAADVDGSHWTITAERLPDGSMES